ncbi:ANTAR domain-containing response regulator [Enterococcus rivorum]|uniref:Fis family transcriptional regulator n=1 Tax=Enterococcus rivorum TaxID=762845 RepID=A0A1E5KWG1_9ENTE|nr:response regulator [Enterococcus rivorum]MBP2099057.1 response regulator NasT [Enterococcus rivorum]OEH82201.1 Fis family transcriptional regulator [Enterococcus rivorum]
MNGRIVIVDDEPITRMDIRGMLEAENYEVVGEASDGIEAIELCKKHLPDLVIMDISMPLLDGLKASKKILDEKYTKSIILLTAYSDKENIEKAKKYGVSGYLVKPIMEKSLTPMVEVAIANGAKTREYELSLEKLTKKLSDRKLIEKAKGIIMVEQKLSEEEAYQLLRELSMNKRCPISEIAEMFVVSDDD